YPKLSDEVARYIGEESDWDALYPFLLRIGESTEKFPHEDYSDVIRVCRERLQNEEDSVIQGGLRNLLERLEYENS
ncbi:MAG: hypothetical protein ACOC7K_02570, partial [bacterium]